MVTLEKQKKRLDISDDGAACGGGMVLYIEYILLRMQPKSLIVN